MSFVLTILENLDQAPGPVAVRVGDCTPAQVGMDCDFTLDSDPTVLLSTVVDVDGVVEADVPIPAGTTAGTHTITATVGGSSDTHPFDIINDALAAPNDDEDPDPIAPIVGPFSRWTLIDNYPGEEETFTLSHNPAAWDGPPERPAFYTFDAACGPAGQILTWQNAGRAWPMQFSGTLFTQAEYHDMLRWVQKKRRFWLYDHRHMMWRITFTDFQPRPRVRGIWDGNFDPWIVDYTMVTLVFNKPGDQPFVIEEEVAIP